MEWLIEILVEEGYNVLTFENTFGTKSLMLLNEWELPDNLNSSVNPIFRGKMLTQEKLLKIPSNGEKRQIFSIFVKLMENVGTINVTMPNKNFILYYS